MEKERGGRRPLFELDEATPQGAKIKVVGLGGGGGNAISRMLEAQFTGVDFIVGNTDNQALRSSPAPVKIQLGANLTKGLGAGSDQGHGGRFEHPVEIANGHIDSVTERAGISCSSCRLAHGGGCVEEEALFAN